MLKRLFEPLLQWYLGALDTGGYPLIALLMAAESSLLPLPSELIIPPAAHLAHSTGRFSVAGIVIAGALGSWLGATAMYWAARAGGRPLLARYGPYAGISAEKISGAERWASQFGSVGVFISRLLPVVRHLIGIPAGIVKMDYKLFSLFTLLGSTVWCAVLCWVGIKMGQDEQLMKGELHRVTLWIGGAVLILGAAYYLLVHRQMRGKG
jgi:membrane protein DedA with SNARE-associated domain